MLILSDFSSDAVFAYLRGDRQSQTTVLYKLVVDHGFSQKSKSVCQNVFGVLGNVRSQKMTVSVRDGEKKKNMKINR